jgi:hypothetical protein
MSLTIIEDCSPFYIRFTYDGIENVMDYCKENMPVNTEALEKFTHHKLSKKDGQHMLNLIPFSNKFNFLVDRVSLFLSKPGLNYRAHKDGLNAKFSINYAFLVADDKCVTSWYSDEDIDSKYSIVDSEDPMTAQSREALGFKAENHTPVKTMTAQPGECVLFNTDIYHSFDNSASTNLRGILTLRISAREYDVIDFRIARAILFGY